MRISKTDNMVGSLGKLEDKTKALVKCKKKSLFDHDKNILH